MGVGMNVTLGQTRVSGLNVILDSLTQPSVFWASETSETGTVCNKLIDH